MVATNRTLIAMQTQHGMWLCIPGICETRNIIDGTPDWFPTWSAGATQGPV